MYICLHKCSAKERERERKRKRKRERESVLSRDMSGLDMRRIPAIWSHHSAASHALCVGLSLLLLRYDSQAWCGVIQKSASLEYEPASEPSTPATGTRKTVNARFWPWLEPFSDKSSLNPVDRLRVSRGEKVLYSGTDPGSYITEYTFVYEDNMCPRSRESSSRIARP